MFIGLTPPVGPLALQGSPLPILIFSESVRHTLAPLCAFFHGQARWGRAGCSQMEPNEEHTICQELCPLREGRSQGKGLLGCHRVMSSQGPKLSDSGQKIGTIKIQQHNTDGWQALGHHLLSAYCV